jgi:hypothetical protein
VISAGSGASVVADDDGESGGVIGSAYAATADVETNAIDNVNPAAERKKAAR